MWVLNGAGEQIINLDCARRIFIHDVGDNVLIGADLNGHEKVAPLGKYHTMEEARKILSELTVAMDGSLGFYIMPVNCYDVVYNRKIMDSRVKRRGGS